VLDENLMTFNPSAIGEDECVHIEINNILSIKVAALKEIKPL